MLNGNLIMIFKSIYYVQFDSKIRYIFDLYEKNKEIKEKFQQQ